jgi:basic amino acid/polyamine antiporter, APA family
VAGIADDATIERLEKRLGLLDVYAICTGAMFASGFFLLPGIAAANAGPSVVLAYLLSSILMIPGMFSIAELSSAMPRAAGTYFFIHRSLGPLAGTIGGFGDWLVLTFKSAFALVGMGAYLAIFLDVPIQPLAVALTVAFGVLNIMGAKETSRLQIGLVVTLLAIMAFYVAQGLIHAAGLGWEAELSGRLTPVLPFGAAGLVSTIGLVFISYAGLTKVAAAAEEIDNLDRNLPLGMFLALSTIAVIYVGGVFIMVAVIEPEVLHADLTPVATAGEAFLSWLPAPGGLILVVVAAIAAFASTGNAGIMTASRYPLAMARDRLTWSGFDQISRFGTPTVGILATCALMIASILFLDVEALAKLGSAFLLLMFAFINLSVIIMRESRIESYAPGYRSPLYPWIQIVGFVTTLGLLFTLGPFSVAFVLVIIAAASLWYRFYARSRVPNRGAIYALFHRMGQNHDQGVDRELWGILQERGASDTDPFEELVARAPVIDWQGQATLEELVGEVAEIVAERTPLVASELGDKLVGALGTGVVPASGAGVIHDLVLNDIDTPQIVLVRVSNTVAVDDGRRFPGQEDDGEDRAVQLQVEALVFLVSPEGQPTQHLRMLAQLASMMEEPGFEALWRRADSDQELRETLLRDERYVSLVVGDPGPGALMADMRLRDLTFPGNSLVALVRRENRSIIPHGDTILRDGDRITIIGTPDDVASLFDSGQA